MEYLNEVNEDSKDSLDFIVKNIENKEHEYHKSKINTKVGISTFIIKKEYFISHKTSNIQDEYDIEKKPIGEGSFGKVFKATEKSTGIMRAIKQIMHKYIVNYDGFINEVAALKTLDHPNIVKLYEVFEDSNWIYLVEEFWEGGELFDYIADRERLSELDTARIFHQIISVIIYWHKNWIWHRGLKPDNFMFSTKNQHS